MRLKDHLIAVLIIDNSHIKQAHKKMNTGILSTIVGLKLAAEKKEQCIINYVQKQIVSCYFY